jgi:predicted dehydrogenase
MDRVAVGIVGCGNISDIYIKNCRELFDNLEIRACADLIPERAIEKAELHHIPRACGVDELLADPDIRVIINLTVPKAHAEVCISALNAGKHVYVEKPLATNSVDGREILETAQKRNLLVGCAPDTFLGGGLQTSKKLIQDGWIGKPIAASAFYTSRGHEQWHPDPEFFYKTGGGPMFDMGPYFITALVFLLGPVRRASGLGKISFAERTITSRPLYGRKIEVEVPTHVAGILEFHAGAIVSLITSFDIWATHMPFLEVHGSEGTLEIHHPNNFGGPIRLRRANTEDWVEIPSLYRYTDNSRGIGVAEMAYALQRGEDPRASGTLGYHVLDIMESVLNASREGRCCELASRCESPQLLPLNWPGELGP